MMSNSLPSVKNVAAIISGLLLFTGLSVSSTASEYLGRGQCTECHPRQHKLWTNSHHDLAMQSATPDTVLGDFDSTTFIHKGIITTFFKHGNRFMVRTDGPDGKLQDYEIKYVFGVYPLQQYLIPLAGGRLQAFTVAWDTRPRSEGGQRWFHLYPQQHITHEDELHWTGVSFNWNGMCAECHSTALKKNYDSSTNVFTTSWSEIDVSCEACHGPASDHVLWARRGTGWNAHEKSLGLVVRFNERDRTEWKIDPGNGNADRNRENSTRTETQVCAQCHSRRSRITDSYTPGESFTDHYLPRLLDDGMYFPDGQIDEEVYVYGSFLQSKMYKKGVTCSDCHEPHSLQLRAPGNGVCLPCHSASRFDVQSHHFHDPGTEGASCIECHMSPRTYMVVDPRHDHSFRIPRPDQSDALGTPNACNRCHRDKSAQWAAEQLSRQVRKSPAGLQKYGPALHAARSVAAGADSLLREQIENSATPEIAVATAVSLLPAYPDPQNRELLESALSHNSPLIRQAAVGTLGGLPAQLRVPLAFPMLNDRSRIVRIEAARILAGIPAGGLPDEQMKSLEKANREYLISQQINADRPEALLNLGNFQVATGNLKIAAASYLKAIELDPAFIPAYVNLADLYRVQQKNEDATRILNRALKRSPNNASVCYALGMALVRQQKTSLGLEALSSAARLAPDYPRFTYVYAVALNSEGKTDQALKLLQNAHRKFPDNRNILEGLITLYRDSGNAFAARTYMKKLDKLQQHW